MNSLIDAVHNGKSVTVVVELQARFDEEANIEWSKVLTDAGVHVIFGAPGLKIHSKLPRCQRFALDELIDRCGTQWQKRHCGGGTASPI